MKSVIQKLGLPDTAGEKEVLDAVVKLQGELVESKKEVQSLTKEVQKLEKGQDKTAKGLDDTRKEAKQYLKDNPDLESVTFTSDGFLFRLEDDARNHALKKGVKFSTEKR